MAVSCQAFIDKFRFNAKRASLVQSRIKALERMAEVEVTGRGYLWGRGVFVLVLVCSGGWAKKMREGMCVWRWRSHMG